MFERVTSAETTTENVEKRRLTPALVLAASLVAPTISSGQETSSEASDDTSAGAVEQAENDSVARVEMLKEHFAAQDQERDIAFAEMNEIFTEVTALQTEYYGLSFDAEGDARKKEIDELVSDKFATFISQGQTIIDSHTDLMGRINESMVRAGIDAITPETLEQFDDSKVSILTAAGEALESATTDTRAAADVAVRILMFSNLMIKPEIGHQEELKQLLDQMDSLLPVAK